MAACERGGRRAEQSLGLGLGLGGWAWISWRVGGAGEALALSAPLIPHGCLWGVFGLKADRHGGPTGALQKRALGAPRSPETADGRPRCDERQAQRPWISKCEAMRGVHLVGTRQCGVGSKAGETG